MLVPFAGFALGFALTVMALVGLVRASRQGEPASPLSIAALFVSVGLTAACLAAAVALGRRHLPRDPAPPAAPTPVVAQSLEAHEGHALAVDPGRLADAEDVGLPIVRMHLRVPRTWEVRKRTAIDLELADPAAPSTFVAARVAPMPSGPSAAEYLAADLEHARNALAGGRIAGFATRHLGAITGVVTLVQEGGTVSATWTGYEPAQGGAVAVTIVLGAAAEDEPLAGAMLDSVQFQ